MSFQPDSHELGQVIQLLQHSQSTDRDVQRQVQQQLVQLNEHQQFCCYLVYILSEMKQAIDATSRSLAGLLLKNNIRAKWNKYPTEVKFFVRSTCLKSIGDPEPLIRATVGIIVTTIVMEENMVDWPDLLDTLATLLMQPDELLQEGALGALQKVFEDSADRYESEYLRPIMPQLLIFYDHHLAKMRALAMNCVNCILMVNNDPIDHAVDPFLTALFARHNDEDEEVQKQLCRSLTLLLDTHMEKMMPHLPNVIEYIIRKTQDGNESIALEACEFWLSIAENNEICRSMVLPHLDKLIPVLLGSMRYSEGDPALKANDEDSSVPDRDEDIRPRFHKSKQHGMGGLVESDEEDEEDDEDGGGDWNIRRCSAASLDVLASIFGKDLLDKLFPLLKETLTSDNWLVKESGILALGAIAEGCMDGVVPHLGELIPFMSVMMFDKKPLVRSITCWTISRYSSHIVSDENFREAFFKEVLANLLRCSLDSNKKVQEAACSAFATLEEEAGDQLIPFLGEILEKLVQAFQCYQAKNLLILYDAIGTLANAVGDSLSEPQHVQILMPPLMQKWERLSDEDKELFPLLECISAIVSAIGHAFIPYIEPVFARCCLLIEKCVQQNQQHAMAPDQVEAAETDFIIVALDLLSGLAESLPEHMEILVANSKLVELMLFCAMDQTTDVRQSCFALLGDLVKACPQKVLPQSKALFPSGTP
uniref:Importin N-terminal domain-containing protein n=1 Tax=Caenorhabditis japonica TaxID=281687 RepID=A0A8R1E2H0_CAEJA